MNSFSRILRIVGTLLVALSFSCVALVGEAQTTGNASSGAPATASAASAGATITGTVIDVNNQLPVSGASITLYNGDRSIGTTTTDTNGSFTFPSETPGAYSVEITSNGYQSARSETVFVTGNSSSSIRTALQRAPTSAAQQLRQIGRVSASSQAGALQTSSTITQNLNSDLLQREANLRVGDALQTLPGVTSFSLDSAPGDDLNISIRGFRPTEVQTLLDGHPIGPIGVASGLSSSGYNFQLSPSFSLQNIQVAYGTGGEALHGTESLAGTIDFQTINPTVQNQFTVLDGVGLLGREETSLTATGQIGRLGYAANYGVQGTYGTFAPQNNTQNALLVNGLQSDVTKPQADITSGNVAANTWNVSGNYLVRQGLLKLRYDVTPTTALTLQAYNATSWDDKTGEGDNDNWPAEYTGYYFDQNANQPGTNCGGILVATDSGNQCFNRNQFVSRFSGPYGGTGVAWQAVRNQDYSGDFRTSFGNNTFRITGFTDNNFRIYNRNESGQNYQYKTFGGTVSDTISMKNNTFGFGYFAEHQLYNFANFNSSGITPNPGLLENFGNYFVRDEFTPTNRLSALFTGWVKQSSVTNSTAFDPRISLVGRPDSNDVVRLSVGESHADPNIALRSSPVVFNNTPGNINPIAPPGLTNVATGSNPNLFGERAQDIEISLGHRFQGDSQISITGFSTNEYNPIFSGTVPLSSAGITAGTIDPTLLAGYLARIPGGRFSNLGISTAFNAGSGRYLGLNVTGRYRPIRPFFIDYGYNLTSSRLFGIPQNILSTSNNWTLIDGGQIPRVPYQTASLGLDVTLHGIEVRMDNFYTGHNNALLRPAYYFANATVSGTFGDGFTLNAGVTNLFNSQYDQYGQLGLGYYQPENQYGQDNGNSLQQQYSGPGAERFGIPPRTFVFTFQKRFVYR